MIEQHVVKEQQPRMKAAPLMKTTKTKPQVTDPSGAMHSTGSPDWGTPPVLRRFSQVTLRPAASDPHVRSIVGVGRGSIDLDYATSAYWQAWWPDGDRPLAYLDGSKGRDVLVEAHRRAAAPQLGSGHFNAPGFGGGEMVQQCWELFEEDHRLEKLGSGFWVGFSVEQFGSLQNVGERNPLTTDADDLITTIVPSRRAHYVLHPEALIAITRKKQKKRDKTNPKQKKQWEIEQKLLKRLRDRTDDEPVDGGAPSHLSYLTILWHRDRDIRGQEMSAARRYLKEQQGLPKSTLFKFEVIGPLEA